MHGNSSARPEALTIISLVLSLGATLFCFDFCGSGLSDGSHVSLGVNEKDDLQAAIEYLRAQGTTSYIALWGRSMGAGTALLHGERDPSIAGMVLDSCYADLTMLAEEMVEKGRQHGLFAPGMLVRMALSFIRSTIQKTAGFDIKDVSPIKGADKCFIPAMFVAARGDDFVTPRHSENICEVYGGDHNLVKVDGDHNSNRPYFLFQSASIFLTNALMLPESWGLPDAAKYIGGVRPWDPLGPDMGGPPYKRGPKLKPYFVGMDEEDAALERVLALSLQEHANVQSQTQGKAVDSSGAPSGAAGSGSRGGLLSTASDISTAQPGGAELGMTRRRQEDVHQAIYTMFGGTASNGNADAGSGVGSSSAAVMVSQSLPSSLCAATPSQLEVIRENDDGLAGGLYGVGKALSPGPAAVSSLKKGSGTVNDTASASASGSNHEPVSQAESIATAGSGQNSQCSLNSLNSFNSGSHGSTSGREVLAASDENEGRIGMACSMCTLINSPNERFCAACNHPLMPNLEVL